MAWLIQNGGLYAKRLSEPPPDAKCPKSGRSRVDRPSRMSHRADGKHRRLGFQAQLDYGEFGTVEDATVRLEEVWAKELDADTAAADMSLLVLVNGPCHRRG